MKKFIKALKSAPKRSAFLAVIAAAVVVPAGLLAWGPDRPSVDAVKGADHVVFNSMTNNPNYGNERQFITVREAGSQDTADFKNDIKVQPGKEYEVRVLIHNDANPEKYPDKNLDAINTTLRTAVSAKTGTSSAITAYVTADNATPKQVHADVKFNSGNGKEFNLAYIQGSAKIYNNGYAAGGQGKPFSDMMTTQSGAKVGYANEGDGIVPGCFEYISYVYFKVKPQFAATPDFTVEKAVSQTGNDKYQWKKDLEVQPGEKVAYRIKYKNTGEVQHDNVVVKDMLPEHMNYVKGSTKLFNSQNMNGKQLNDDVTSKGINIGSHAAGGASYVVFEAEADKLEDLECGLNKLTNKVIVETDYGQKEDTADVTVKKECQPEEGEIIVCDLTTNKVITIDEDDFDSSKHTKDLSKCQSTEENCPIPGKEHLPVDSEECVEAPEELPTTGSGSMAGTVVGLIAITTAAGYYFASRRGLGL